MKTKLNTAPDFRGMRRWSAYKLFFGFAPGERGYCFVRKTFKLDFPSGKAELRIMAESAYKLYIDGKLVSVSSVRASSHSMCYDEYDLGGMESGEHCIALHIYNIAVRTAPLSMICELDLERETLISDASWRFLRDDSYRLDAPTKCWIRTASGDIEVRDMRAVPDGWTMASFDDSTWCAAIIDYRRDFSGRPVLDQPIHAIDKYWRYLRPRDIPQLRLTSIAPAGIVSSGECIGGIINANRDMLGPHLFMDDAEIKSSSFSSVTECGKPFPIKLHLHTKGQSTFGRIYYRPAVVFDFGELMNAMIRLNICAGEGMIINVAYSQTFEDGRVHPYTGAVYRAMRYTLKEGENIIESFKTANFRYLQITVYEGQGDLTLLSCDAVKVEYPIEREAEFSCSDETLTRIFKVETLTLKSCMNDTFVDNTWRENNAWGGDVMVSASCALAHFGDIALVKRYLRMFAIDQNAEGLVPMIVPDNIGGIFDHQLSYPLRVLDYYLFTGDDETLGELYPAVRRLMSYFERYEDERGFILDTPEQIWFDWAELDLRLPSLTLNFMYLLMLLASEELACYNGSYEDGEIYKTKAELLAAVLAEYRNDDGTFSDSLLDSSHITENTNALALCCESSSDEGTKKLVERVFEPGFSLDCLKSARMAGPSFSNYVLIGLSRCGRYDLACDYIKDRIGSAFDMGLESLPETWYYIPSGETSAAQATVTSAQTLLYDILGIKAIAPGFSEIMIAPHPCKLEWARGSVISPKGRISAEFKIDGEILYVNCSAPQSVRVSFRAPDGFILRESLEFYEPCAGEKYE